MKEPEPYTLYHLDSSVVNKDNRGKDEAIENKAGRQKSNQVYSRIPVKPNDNHIQPSVSIRREFMDRSSKPDLMNTLKRLEIKRPNKLESIPSIKGIGRAGIFPREEQSQLTGRARAESGRTNLQRKYYDDDESDDEEKRMKEMVDVYYKKKEGREIEISPPETNRMRIQTGSKRIESSYVVKGNKNLLREKVESGKYRDQVRDSQDSGLSKKFNNVVEFRPIIISKNNFPIIKDINNSAVVREASNGRLRQQSNYSTHQNSSGISFHNNSTDLHKRYMVQIQKAIELREQGRQIHNSIDRKFEDILHSALKSRVRKDGLEAQIRVKMNVERPTSKIEGDHLEYAKMKGKNVSRIEDWSSHLAAGYRNSEGSKYVISNLRRIDEEAQIAEDEIVILQKKPDWQKPVNRNRKVEDKYLESIRAKFSFLEG